MEIVKPHHRPSREVEKADLARAIGVASDMREFLDSAHPNAYALSHCQVESDDPLRVFVVSKIFVGEPAPGARETARNFYFPSRAIFNARIVSAPKTVARKVAQREVFREGKEVKARVGLVEKDVSNVIRVPEACLSYPFRKGKNRDRFFAIRVRYQIEALGWMGKTKLVWVEEDIEGAKAHVFQHEVDHGLGIDMYFGDGRDDDPTRPYAA